MRSTPSLRQEVVDSALLIGLAAIPLGIGVVLTALRLLG